MMSQSIRYQTLNIWMLLRERMRQQASVLSLVRHYLIGTLPNRFPLSPKYFRWKFVRALKMPVENCLCAQSCLRHWVDLRSNGSVEAAWLAQSPHPQLHNVARGLYFQAPVTWLVQ